MSTLNRQQPVAGPSSPPTPIRKRKRGEAGPVSSGSDVSRRPQRVGRSVSTARSISQRRRRERHDEEESASESEADDDLQEPEAYQASYSGRAAWTYHLEIIQHPQRVRACGFGNKDRRPLSPPPIIRLWVRTSSGQLVDPALVDTRFLVLMVDLWSADRQQERNVVMHPVSAGVSRMDSPTMSGLALSDLPGVPGPSSRPSTGTSRPMSGSSAALSSLSSSSWRPSQSSPSSTSQQTTRPYPSAEPSASRLHRPSTADARLQPVTPSVYAGGSSSHSDVPSIHTASGAGIAYHQQRLLGRGLDPPRPNTAPSTQPLSSSIESPRRGSYNLPPLASISELQEINTSASSRLTLPALHNAEQLGSSSSMWDRPRTGHSTADASIPPTDYSFGRPGSSSSWQAPSYPVADYGREGRRPSSSWSDMRPWSSGLASQRLSTSSDSTVIRSPQSRWEPSYNVDRRPSETYGSLYPGTLDTPRYSFSGYSMSKEQYPAGSWDADRGQYIPGQVTTAAAQYSRVLVGKVTAVCHKLQDENGLPGLFFFAADLGIRTEGTFTLRLALTDLSSLMRPNISPEGRAPILAEIFTEPFTVFSAKRFPGVIPTTPLTKAFAAQGVKLSVRENRKGGGDGGDEGEEDE